VEDVGARLLFLTACSPDFNPIELAFANIKQHLRTAPRCTRERLLTTITEAIDAISEADARVFDARCDFPLSAN
jgi:transposase